MAATIVVPDVGKGIQTLVTTAPHWVCLLLVVAGFLWYLERHDTRRTGLAQKGEALATLRMSQCHDIQSKSIAAMTQLTSALHEQDVAFGQLANAIEHISHD